MTPYIPVPPPVEVMNTTALDAAYTEPWRPLVSPGVIRLALTLLLGISLFLNPWDAGSLGGLPRALLVRYLTVLAAAPLLLAELLRLRRINPSVLFAVIFLVFAWIRGTDTALPVQAMFTLRYYTVALLSFMAIVSLDLGDRQIAFLVWAHIFGCAVAVFEMHTGAIALDAMARASVENINPNFTAYCCVHGASLAVLWYRKGRAGIIPLLAVVSVVALSVYGITLTATRGAFLALFPLLILFVLELPIKSGWVKAVLILAIPVVAFLVVQSSPTLMARFKGEAGTSDYGSERLDLWATAEHLFMKAPAFGIGPGQFAHPYSEQGMPVHNVFLSVLAEFGLFGWLVYMAFLVACFLWARQRHGLLGACVFFIPWALISFTGAWESAFAPYACFGLVVALGRDGDRFRGAPVRR